MKKIINKFIDLSECELETKADETNTGKLIIKGYANIAKVDRVNEIMPKDCWDLQNYKKNPKLCMDHKSNDSNFLIGKAVVIEARDEGLYFEAEIGDESKAELTPNQKIARSLVKQGYLTALSVGFRPVDYEYDTKSETLIYKKAELNEISLVTVPCQQDSFITSIKSLESLVNIDDENITKLNNLEHKLNELTLKVAELEVTTDSTFKNVFNSIRKLIKIIPN